MIKLIVAVNGDGMIDFKAPRLDLIRFKVLTLGGTVIMGRKTWLSLPLSVRPLVGRTNVILSRAGGSRIFNEDEWEDPSTFLYDSLENALNDWDGAYEDCWIIGGGEIYKQAISSARMLYISRFTLLKGGSVPFPDPIPNDFKLIHQESDRMDHMDACRFEIWKRDP